MCLDTIKKWWNDLFGKKQYRTTCEVRVFPGCRGQVRTDHNINIKTDWYLQENEVATVGIDPDGKLHEYLQDKVYLFYEIQFGKKYGWLRFQADRMELVWGEVEV